MIRYAISFFAFILWLLISPTGVFAQSAVLSLDPASGTFNRGCDFSLNVNLDTGNAQTDGTDVILFYDVSRFTAGLITNGTIYPDYPGNNIDSHAGKITISGLSSVNTPFTGKGIFATVNFKVNDTAATGATQINFDFDRTGQTASPQCMASGFNTCDSNVVERGTVVDDLSSVVNGNYIIGSGTCGAVQSSSSPSPSPFQSSGVAYQSPSPYRQTGGPISTTSATIAPLPIKQQVLPPAGSEQFTFTVAIFGGALTVLGILGLALL